MSKIKPATADQNIVPPVPATTNNTTIPEKASVSREAVFLTPKTTITEVKAPELKTKTTEISETAREKEKHQEIKEKPKVEVNKLPAKKTFFDSDSDEEDSFLQHVVYQRPVLKEIPSVPFPIAIIEQPIVNKAAQLVQSSGSSNESTTNFNAPVKPVPKKSLFDDSDSDSDLFTSSSKIKPTSAKSVTELVTNPTVTQAFFKSQLASTLSKQPVSTVRINEKVDIQSSSQQQAELSAQKNESSDENQITTILKTRPRGPQHRRLPTRSNLNPLEQ
ncbi:unnamed protein product [Caenorhabditis sp. 36 PRJEB53466]|nr:unnamed protein product [Caenorhabditis sp. 36 PRJEB53466]